jgi:hypothetical protein
MTEAMQQLDTILRQVNQFDDSRKRKDHMKGKLRLYKYDI